MSVYRAPGNNGYNPDDLNKENWQAEWFYYDYDKRHIYCGGGKQRFPTRQDAWHWGARQFEQLAKVKKVSLVTVSCIEVNSIKRSKLKAKKYRQQRKSWSRIILARIFRYIHR